MHLASILGCWSILSRLPMQTSGQLLSQHSASVTAGFNLARGFGAPSASTIAKFGNVTDLVTFGDSYTDERRLNYFLTHNGQAPPLGYEVPESNTTYSGGFVWPRLLSRSMGVKVHNYAVGGAGCSHKFVARYCDRVRRFFPSVHEYRIPTFLAEFDLTKSSTSSRPLLNPSTTLFSIWIGANDMGNGALLTNEQQPGATLTDIADCAVQSIQKLYDAGARNFVFMNIIPLDMAPQYASPERQGVKGNNHYFPNKNHVLGGSRTAISTRMKELTTTANQISRASLAALSEQLEDARIAHFDTHVHGRYREPRAYLRAPYDTMGFECHCASSGCSSSYIRDPQHLDGYLWYDELHPSEMANVIVAREFSNAIRGQSKHTTYFF